MNRSVDRDWELNNPLFGLFYVDKVFVGAGDAYALPTLCVSRSNARVQARYASCDAALELRY